MKFLIGTLNYLAVVVNIITAIIYYNKIPTWCLAIYGLFILLCFIIGTISFILGFEEGE